MIYFQNHKNLLRSVHLLLEDERQKEILRGESFNVFSILGMERRENDTHSAFLGELLNPNGSHKLGSIFLAHFLRIIEDDTMDLTSTTLTLEYHMGARNDETKTGGRVDIYLADKLGNSICIENKIDAGDQFAQVERYCKHNTGRNKVFYLTLRGTEAGEQSRGVLKAGEHYQLLSYRENILAWLQECLKEAVTQPLLRESIRQYIVLIKKITSTMEKPEEKRLVELILSHYDEAVFIAENLPKVQQRIAEDLRQIVIKQLISVLPVEYNISPGADTSKVYSQVWFRFSAFPDSSLYFGLESFSGKGNFGGELFIGIFHANSGKKSQYSLEPGIKSLSAYWMEIYKIQDLKGQVINLSNKDILLNLHTDPIFFSQLANHIVMQIQLYLEKQGPSLRRFLDREKNEQLS